MNKVILPHSNEQLLRACHGQMWQLVETEKHVKSASSDVFSEDLIRRHLPDKDHFMIHLVAMGGGEHYGPNRNGDFWDESGLMTKHGTFVTHGHFFREHHHQDPKLAIGTIKASAYHPKLHRVELIVWGNKKKAAAEYESARKGEERTYSMSARVPYDQCSICEHKAPTPEHYCLHAKYGMLRYHPQHQKFAYVRNPHPTFFDLSDVSYQADRIAYFLEYRLNEGEEMLKAASVGEEKEFAFHSAKIAKLLKHTDPDIDSTIWLRKLSEAESLANATDTEMAKMANLCRHTYANHTHPSVELTDAYIDTFRRNDPDVLITKLARAKVLMPFDSFMAYCKGITIKEASEAPEIQAARQVFPGVFGRIQSEPLDPDLLNMFQPASLFKMACACTGEDVVDKAIAEMAGSRHSEPKVTRDQILKLSLSPTRKSAASATPKLTDLYAKLYAHYKLATVKTWAQHFGADFVDVPRLILVTSIQ